MLKIFASKPERLTLAAAALVFFSTLAASFRYIHPQQWLLLFLMLVVSALAYARLSALGGAEPRRALPLVIAAYLFTAVTVFYPTVFDLFRSDYWLIATKFKDPASFSWKGLREIAFFEIFGHIRFQPLAHLLMFLRYIVLGDNLFLYHLLNMVLHATTAVFIFLLLKEATGSEPLSFLAGLMYIVLPAQFDTVSWTYHIYIIAGTILTLWAFFLALRFVSTGATSALVKAGIVSLVSLYLYEPSVLVPAAVLLLVLFPGPSGEAASGRKVFKKAVIVIGAVYVFYMLSTLYGYMLTREAHVMSPGQILSFKNILKGLGITLSALWESVFIKNIGVEPEVNITNIVYLYLPHNMWLSPSVLLKIAAGVFVISLFRMNKENRSMVLVLSAVAFVYLFVISLGRAFTNQPSYVPSQPRYIYFPDALLVPAAAMLVWPCFNKRGLRPALLIVLSALFIWNARNTLHANNMVTAAMRPQNVHYYRVKEFFSSNPSAKLFLDFVPGSRRQFYMGSDIALDIMFSGRITKFIKEATHTYDGRLFRRNVLYSPGPRPPYLEGFTISWVHRMPRYLPLNDEVVIIGSDDVYPRISVTPDKRIKVAMKNADTKVVDFFLLKSGKWFDKGIWSYGAITLVKDGDNLCLFMGERLDDRIKLDSQYMQWTTDGIGLLGRYYRGTAQPVFVSDLFIQLGVARLRCGD